MYRGHRVILIPPAYNETGKIGRAVTAVPRDVVDEVLVVDDGSTDGTAEEAREAGARVISHGRRRGVGACIRTGIDHARRNSFDIIAVMAGNNKDRPEELPRLLDPIVEGRADYVQGSRYLPGGEHGTMPLHRRFGTRLYPLIFFFVLGKRLTDSTNGFRAYRAALFDDPRINLWQDWLDGYELEYYLHYKVLALGYRYHEEPVTKLYSSAGSSYRTYTKARPVLDWWRMLRPVI